MKVKIKSLFLIFCLLFCLVGCSSYATGEALTTDSFTTIVYENVDNVEIKNVLDDFKNTKGVTTAIGLSESGYIVQFVVFDSMAEAKDFANSSGVMLESASKQLKDKKSVSNGNFYKFELETEDSYYLITCVDNTVLYINGTTNNIDFLKDLSKELGYY